MKKTLPLLFWLCFVSMAPHPLKMCVCDVKYRPDAPGMLSFKFKFFWDDLEAVLEKRSGRDLSLNRPSPDNDRLLAEFVRTYFELKIDDRPVPLTLVRSDVQDVVLVVEFTGGPVAASPSYRVDLRNAILLDAFPDQYNLVRFDFFGDGNLTTLRFEKAENRLVKTISKR